MDQSRRIGHLSTQGVLPVRLRASALPPELRLTRNHRPAITCLGAFGKPVSVGAPKALAARLVNRQVVLHKKTAFGTPPLLPRRSLGRRRALAGERSCRGRLRVRV